MEVGNFSFGFNNPHFSELKLKLNKEDQTNPQVKKRKSDANIESNEPEAIEEEMFVSKLHLAGQSGYFKALFSNGMKESQQKEVTISMPEEEIPIFKDLIKFMYTNKIDTPTPSLLNFLVLADKYEVPSAIRECSVVLSTTLNDVGKCIEYLQALNGILANHNFEPLLKQCEQVLHREYHDFDKYVTEDGPLLELTSEALQLVLKNDNMKVYIENTVFELVLRWFNYDKPNRCTSENAYSILKLIRYPLMTPGYLFGYVIGNPIFDLIPTHREEIQEILGNALYVSGLPSILNRAEFTELFDDDHLVKSRRRNMDAQFVRCRYRFNILSEKGDVYSPYFSVHGHQCRLHYSYEDDKAHCIWLNHVPPTFMVVDFEYVISLYNFEINKYEKQFRYSNFWQGLDHSCTGPAIFLLSKYVRDGAFQARIKVCIPSLGSENWLSQ